MKDEDAYEGIGKRKGNKLSHGEEWLSFFQFEQLAFLRHRT